LTHLARQQECRLVPRPLPNLTPLPSGSPPGALRPPRLAVRVEARRLPGVKRFAPLAAEIATAFLNVRNAILDGEVVCPRSRGRPLFSALLIAVPKPCFVAFDCLWLKRAGLTRPAANRAKRVLYRIIPRRTSLCAVPASRRHDAAWISSPRSSSATSKRRRQAQAGALWPRDSRSPWVKIKNREYSQAMGRHEQFDSFRG